MNNSLETGGTSRRVRTGGRLPINITRKLAARRKIVLRQKGWSAKILHTTIKKGFKALVAQEKKTHLSAILRLGTPK